MHASGDAEFSCRSGSILKSVYDDEAEAQAPCQILDFGQGAEIVLQLYGHMPRLAISP